MSDRLQKELYKVINRISKKPLAGKANFSETKLRADFYTYTTDLVNKVLETFKPIWGTFIGNISDQTDLQAALDAKQSLAEKGIANGYASLDGTGRIPTSQLTIEALEYKGSYNASTNTPALADGVGQTGDFYINTAEADRDLGSGVLTFGVGEWIVYDGTKWNVTPPGGGLYLYDGVAYVDSNATPASGVFGDISKPFTDLTEAINAIPINTPTTVKCLDATPSWGAGGIDMSDKSIYIDAKGKDLTSTVSVFLLSTDSYLTIDCKNFTDSSTFSSGLTVLNIYAEETFTNSVSRIQEAGILTVTAKHLVSSIALSKTNLTLIVETGEITAELTWDTSFLRLHASELMTFSAGGILLNNPITGSVISGNYLLTGSTRFMDRGTGVLLKDCRVTQQGNTFMFTGGQTDCSIQGGYYECGLPLFGYNTSSGFQGKVTKAHFVMASANAQPTNFIFQSEGVTRIVDTIFESTLTSSVNGLSINSGVASISESTFILGDTTDKGVILNGGSITDLGDNDQFPRATKVLDGTEVVKLKVGDGDYQEATTQAIADLAGTAANNIYAETLLVGGWTLDAGTIYYQDVTHNFNSEDVLVEVFDSTTKETVIVETIDRTDTNTVRIKVEGNTDELRVVVFDSGLGVIQQVQDVAVNNPATPYTPTTGDVIDWDCTAGNKVVNLPDASTNANMQINVSKSDVTANTITINALGADTINGSSSITVTTQYELVTLFSTGARWLIK